MTGRTSVVVKVVVVYPLLLIGLSAIHMLAPQRSGPLALTQIFAPYLFLGALALLPLALYQSAIALRLALLVCALIYVVRFVSWRISVPVKETAAATRFSATTWNLLFTNRRVDAIRSALRTRPSDVVALQELAPEHAAEIEHDSELVRRYPHRVLWSGTGSSGMGLLSAHSILEHGWFDMPSTLWARLELGGGRTVTVVNAHPTLVDPQVTRFTSAQRDDQIAQVRALIAPMLQSGEPLLLLGDFNVTEREPAYQELTAGLQDAHTRAGFGSGNTWRPEDFKHIKFGLLRIDYMLSSPNVVPLRMRADCTPYGSDHCVVHGTFTVDPGSR